MDAEQQKLSALLKVTGGQKKALQDWKLAKIWRIDKI